MVRELGAETSTNSCFRVCERLQLSVELELLQRWDNTKLGGCGYRIVHTMGMLGLVGHSTVLVVH